MKYKCDILGLIEAARRQDVGQLLDTGFMSLPLMVQKDHGSYVFDGEVEDFPAEIFANYLTSIRERGVGRLPFPQTIMDFKWRNERYFLVAVERPGFNFVYAVFKHYGCHFLATGYMGEAATDDPYKSMTVTGPDDLAIDIAQIFVFLIEVIHHPAIRIVECAEQKIKNSYRHRKRDRGLSPVKALRVVRFDRVVYERAREQEVEVGLKRRAHNRCAHLRRFRSGKVIWVKGSRINGGTQDCSNYLVQKVCA